MDQTAEPIKFLGVIPARYGSTRFEGKSLKIIAGKPLLQWVIEGSLQSKNLSRLIVATDDVRIESLAKRCGVEVVMTDPSLPSGSDRVWAAVQKIPGDIIINIQGDEPLITGQILDQLSRAFMDGGVEMATLARPFKDGDEILNPTTAKIVLNQRGEALYFSRLPIPHSRISVEQASAFACLKHIGLYGFRRSFLQRFCAQKPVPVEAAEGLEQLRALWLGARIKVVETNYDSWGVDTPEDVIRIEKIMASRRQKETS